MRKLLIVVGIALLAMTPGLSADTLTADVEGSFIPWEPVVGGSCLTIDGTLGSNSGTYPGISGTQTGRLNRNLVVSSCAMPKTCDIFVTDPGRAFDAYTIPNNTGGTVCVDVTLDTITQTACNLQANAYLNTYDPANICEPQSDYLADPGQSSGTPPSQIGFSADVPNGDDLILVVHTTNPGEIGCEYDLIVAATPCIGGPAGESDLVLTKTASPTTVNPGDNTVYTLSVTNNGPDDATSTVVTDNLPAEFSWVSDDCGAGPPAGGPPNGTLTWNVGTLSNGATAVCNVTGTIDGPVGSSVANDATATSDNDDPTPADAADSAIVGIGGSVLEIPTISQMGLIVLLLLFGFAAVWKLRTSEA